MDIVQYKINELKGDAILKLALCELLLNNVADKFEKRVLFAKVAELSNNTNLAEVGKKIGLQRFQGNRYSNSMLNKYKPYADAFEVMIFDAYDLDGVELVKQLITKYLL